MYFFYNTTIYTIYSCCSHRLDYNAKMGLKWSQPFINVPKVHKGSIYACTWSDSGDVIATCSNDKSVKLFLFDEENEKLTGM